MTEVKEDWMEGGHMAWLLGEGRVLNAVRWTWFGGCCLREHWVWWRSNDFLLATGSILLGILLVIIETSLAMLQTAFGSRPPGRDTVHDQAALAVPSYE